MGAAEAATLTVLVLAAAGALPVLLLVGPRVVSVPLMPLAGAVLSGVSAVCSIAVAGSLLEWFLLWSALAAAAALVLFGRYPARAAALWQVARRGMSPFVGLGALVVLVAIAWTLRTLRVPTVGFDAQAIWILHARWLSHGHAFAYAAVRNRFLVLSHPAYPPLVSSVMALAWRITGTTTDRVAVVTTALLNGCALFVAAWGIVEASRRAVTSLGAGARRLRRRLLIGAGILTAALTVLVAGGVLGTFATNGYADPLWSLSAVGVVVFALVLPPGRSDLFVAAILVAVAGLTKVEGTAVAMLLVVVVALRLAIGRPTWPARLRLLPAAVAGLAALLVWPVLTLIIDVPPDPSLTGSRQGSLVSRAHRTLSAMAPHLHVVLVALLCGMAGLFLLRRLRGRLVLGNDLWAWLSLVGAAFVLGGAYVFGPGNVQLWLATSVDRTTIFVALLAWWIVAGWAVCAAGAIGADSA
jgi:hypothetical protein